MFVIIPLGSWFLVVPVHRINPFKAFASFLACGMFNKVKPPTLIGNLGHILLLLVDKDLVIHASIVWYDISLPKSLFETYLGNKCGGEEHLKTLI
jgi:hypothetical protein